MIEECRGSVKQLLLASLLCLVLITGCEKTKQGYQWPDPDPIFSRSKINDVDYVRARVEGGLDIETRNHTQYNMDYLLTYAVRQNAVDTVKYLIQAGADIDIASYGYEKTPLFQAAYDGHVEIAKLLIDHGTDVNAQDISGNRPLREAILGEQPQMVKLLLESGADPALKNQDGQSLFDLADEYAIEEIKQALDTYRN